MKKRCFLLLLSLLVFAGCLASAAELYDPTTPLAGDTRQNANHPLLELSSIGGGIDHDYFAVINGMYVKEGDSVFDVNIIKIEAEKVLYRFQNKMYALMLKP